MKNPLTPAGIEPATFRFVAQHLNHCATAVPQVSCIFIKMKGQMSFQEREVGESHEVDPEREDSVICEEFLEVLTVSFSSGILLNVFFS